MINTIFRLSITGLMFAASSATLAQDSAADVLTENELADAREMIQAARKEIISEELHLTEEEASAFWPIYEKYRGDMIVVRDRHTALITDYVKMYHAQELTNKYADGLIDDFFDIKNDLLRTQKKYVRQFRRILPSLKVARFYQLENKMNADIDSALALAVPLVESD